MKIIKVYILLLIIGLLFSCGEESLPEPIVGTPVFTASGRIGDNLIDFKAGDNDFYMFTDFSKDETNTFIFSGTFAKLEPDCDSVCNEKLRISIRDFQMTEGDLISDIDSSLFLGRYEYDGSQEGTEIEIVTSYDVSFINKTVASFGEEFYTWRFAPNEQDSFEIETFGPEEVPETQNFTTLGFPVTLERLDIPTIVSCKDYTQNLKTSDQICSSGLSIVPGGGGSLTVLSVGLQNTEGLESSIWEDSIGNIFGMESALDISESGEYCVQATYVNGCENKTCINTNIISADDFNYCSVAFDYIVEPQTETIIVPPDNPFSFSTIVIEYVSEDGLSYRSDIGPQSDESQFEILEISDFEDNENGEKTKQLKVRFNCVLYTESDLSLDFENAEIVMAVAYPGA